MGEVYNRVVGLFFFSSRILHTRCALVTGVQRVLFRSRAARRPRPTPPPARPRRTRHSPTESRSRGGSPRPRSFSPHRAALPGRDRIRALRQEIGRASCRERVCQYVSISVVAVSLKKKKTTRG